ncbi:MAG: hypothetical protein AAFP90_19335, partial [Planctomycetota bacterium]
AGSTDADINPAVLELPFREFISRDGKFAVRARVVYQDDDSVWLFRADTSTVISVPKVLLSETTGSYLQGIKDAGFQGKRP